MPNELTLCAVAAAVGALVGGICTYMVTHKLDSVALAHEQKAHSDDIARINATAAQQLADALAKQQAAEGHVATIQQQYDTEVANHAKDSLDYRAKLIAGTQRVRVHVASCGSGTAASESAATPAGTDGSPAYAELPGTVATGVVAVTDDADAQAIKLRKLQDYVKGLQADGFISNNQ
jgi:hypothetical protein